jgi:uncharacterized protein YkwD
MMPLLFYSFLIAFLAFAGIASEALGNDLFRQVAEMVNNERQKVGLKRLAYNNQLEQAALSHSQWMARVGKMEHLQGEKAQDFGDYLKSDHDHATRIMKSGYFQWQDLFDLNQQGNNAQVRSKGNIEERLSEIIAFAGPDTGTVPQQLPIVVPGWMKSPGHRAVIVKNCWNDIGAAFATSRNGSAYYCVTFGNR